MVYYAHEIALWHLNIQSTDLSHSRASGRLHSNDLGTEAGRR